MQRTNNRSKIRSIRQIPFCWQEKPILDLIRMSSEGQQRAKLLCLYLTITWLDNNFKGENIHFYSKTIAKYSGLPIKWIPGGLRQFEKWGIIQIRYVVEGDILSGRYIIFTPKNAINTGDESFEHKGENVTLENKNAKNYSKNVDNSTKNTNGRFGVFRPNAEQYKESNINNNIKYKKKGIFKKNCGLNSSKSQVSTKKRSKCSMGNNPYCDFDPLPDMI